MRTEAQRFDLFHYCADEPTPGPSQEGYLFSPVGASRCSGPRTVSVRSGSSGARTAEFSRPLLTSDALRTGTVRGPFARVATTLPRYTNVSSSNQARCVSVRPSRYDTRAITV